MWYLDTVGPVYFHKRQCRHMPMNIKKSWGPLPGLVFKYTDYLCLFLAFIHTQAPTLVPLGQQTEQLGIVCRWMRKLVEVRPGDWKRSMYFSQIPLPSEAEPHSCNHVLSGALLVYLLLYSSALKALKRSRARHFVCLSLFRLTLLKNVFSVKFSSPVGLEGVFEKFAASFQRAAALVRFDSEDTQKDSNGDPESQQEN